MQIQHTSRCGMKIPWGGNNSDDIAKYLTHFTDTEHSLIVNFYENINISCEWWESNGYEDFPTENHVANVFHARGHNVESYSVYLLDGDNVQIRIDSITPCDCNVPNGIKTAIFRHRTQCDTWNCYSVRGVNAQSITTDKSQ